MKTGEPHPPASECCTACGRQLAYWIRYQLCDVCLTIPTALTVVYPKEVKRAQA